MAEHRIVCGKCGHLLYPFKDVVMVTPDNDLVVRPEVARGPNANVGRMDNPDGGGGYAPKALYCKTCGATVGRVHSEGISKTLTDRITGKSVELEVQGQGKFPVRKWEEQILFLQSLGAESITSAQLATQAGGKYTMRMGDPVHPTILVDVDNTPESTLKALLAKKTPRNYQLEMIQHGLKRNSLVCLPTGSGKTLIAAGIIAAMLHINPKKVVAFIVKTNPLAEQQSHALAEALPKARILTYSGQMDPEMKANSLKKIGKFDYDVLVITCECMNVLVNYSTVRIEDLCCLVLDEAHHAKKNDSYNVLLKKVYQEEVPEEHRPLVLGLTASPVDEKPKGQMNRALEDRIIELSSSLGCVASYPLKHDPYENGISQTYDVASVRSGGDEELKFRRKLDEYLILVLNETTGLISQVSKDFANLHNSTSGQPEKFDTNAFRGTLREVEKELDKERDLRTSESEREIIQKGYAIRNHLNQILAVHEINNVIGHELAKSRMREIFDEIEDPAPGQQTVQKRVLREAGVNGQALYYKFHKELKTRPKTDDFGEHNLSQVCKKIIRLAEEHYEKHKTNSRILVFVDMRRTAKKLCMILQRISKIRAHFNPKEIVGRGLQGDGLTIDEQREILKDFQKGNIRLLISTTILEEGLDVTQCNMVIRLSAPQNLREFIQSRGRACRAKDGVFHIICKDEKEKALQEEFLACVDAQPEIVQHQMQDQLRNGSIQKQGHELKVLDLDEQPCREDNVVEPKLDESEQEDEEIEELMRLMTESEMQPEQKDDLRFLDEFEPGEVALSLRFVWWCKDDPENRKTHYKYIQDITARFTESVLQGEWKDQELEAHTLLLGTKYYPEAKFASADAKGVEEIEIYEKNVIGGLFMTSSIDSSDFDFWVTVKTPHCYFPKSTALRLSLKGVNVGSLVTPKKFICHSPLGLTQRLLVDRAFDSFSITINDKFKIDASFADIQSFIIVDKVNNNEDGVQDPIIRLHFTFNQPPKFSVLEEAGAEDKRKAKVRMCYFNDERTRQILGNCLTYQLEVPNLLSETKTRLLEPRIKQVLRVMESCGKTIYYSHLTMDSALIPVPEEEDGLSEELTIHHASKDVNYAMKCVQSAKGFMHERLDYTFFCLLNQISEERATDALYQLAEVLDKTMFCDYTTELQNILTRSHRQPAIARTSESKNHRYMKRVIITPTKLLFYKPDFIQTNRTVRRNGAEHFIRVGIRDENCENLTTLHGDLANVMNRVRNTLMNGIKVGNVDYHYLASSSSQLRGHSCYFIEDKDHNTANRIRAEQGNLSEITNVGKYVARMGLGFSTSEKTIEVKTYEMEEDIKRGVYTFSDGVGLIAESTAIKVKEKLKLETLPSAFQIRLGGCKGMLVVWKDDFLQKRNYEAKVIIRESMHKFPSDHMSLEVLEKTKPLRLHLNHQVIMLLNNVGVQDQVFMDLLRKDISELGKMFSDEAAAHEVLRCIVAEQVRDLEPVKFRFTTDAYFRQLMMAFYRIKMKDLRERSRVRLDPSKARVLIGVLDEAGVLQPGEVFIQISESLDFPGAEKRVIRSEIVIMKNPCIHPGDVRTFKGVNKPELRHLFDCVVFPQRGLRPHPNELSGSDLDGDQYHCIWDPNLLPQIPIKDPMDYESSSKMEESGNIGVEEMVNYTCEYIENDTLGMIDNTHKALADQLGIEHEECLKLAEIHAKAVDAPKTGNWQSVPPGSRELLKKYPDFMLKHDKPSYPSSNVLGEMFRECNKYISNSLDPLSEGIRGEVIADGAFQVPNHEEFYQDAKVHYRNYSDRLQTIMTMYGIRTEAELVSGHINNVHSRLTEELDDVIKNSKILVKNIINEYYKIFFDDPRLAGPNGAAKQFEKASAWYLVAYGRQETEELTGVTPVRFMSFPWIVSRVLAKIFVHNTTEERLPLKSPELAISKSIAALYSDVISDVIANFEKHGQLCGRISGACRRFGVCNLTGMTSTLLFDRQYGEVGILLMKKPSNNKPRGQDYRLSFLKSLRTELRPITAQEILDASRLHLRIELKDRSLAKRRAEVTTDEWSIYIWATIVAYIKQHHWLHPVLRLLCSWIRNTGLVGGRKMFLPDYLIPCLFIDHCLNEKVIKEINIKGVYNDCKRFFDNPNTAHPLGSINDWEQLCGGLYNSMKSPINSHAWEQHASRTGDLLIKFMKQAKEQFSRPVHPSFTDCLRIKNWNKIEEKDKLNLLISEMEKASHRLVMHVSAGSLLKSIKIEKLFFLKLEAARRLAGNEDNIAKMLHMKCGAVIDIQTKMSDRNKNSGMIVTATGNEAELYLLDREIKLLNRKLENESKFTRAVRVLGMRDLPGAHNLLIDGANSEEKCSIRLEPYYGMKYPQHDYKNLHIVRLFGSSRSALQSSQVDSPVACSFRKHFERQLKTFDNKYSDSVYGECELQIKFGRAYVVSPPRSFTEDAYGLTVDDLLRTLENRRTRDMDPTWEAVTQRKQSMYGARNSTEGFISTSFVSSIVYDIDFQDKVKELAKALKPIKAESGAKMVVEQASGSVTARYKDKNDLTFVGLETSPFRWVVSDIKRHCKSMESNVEGDECDIRFLMKTQTKEVEELEDHAQNWGFEKAIKRDNNDLIAVQNLELDVKFIEDYEAAVYEMKPTPLGIPYNAMIRKSTQYTRKMGVEGKRVGFTSIKTIYELRLLPDVSYLVNSETRNDTLDSLWELAFQYSDFLKADTQDRPK